MRLSRPSPLTTLHRSYSGGSGSDSGSSGESSGCSSINNRKEESLKIVKMALAGNACITTAKAAVWLSTGSSAMLSEAIHSLVDSGNQALLLVGLMDANNKADKKHPYGYGKSIYFWSLVSALGTFWGGACVSMWTSTVDILNPKVVPSL